MDHLDDNRQCIYDKEAKPPRMAELPSNDVRSEGIMSTELLELHDEQLKNQLMSTQVHELDGQPSAQELEANNRAQGRHM